MENRINPTKKSQVFVKLGNLVIWHYYTYITHFFILAFVFVVSEKKNWPLTFWTWRPLLKIWEPDVFLRKKVNFVPWEITWPYHLLIHQNIYFDILSIERLRQPPKHHSWYQFIQKIILYLDYVISTSLSSNQNENRNHAIQKVQTESRKWKISMQNHSQRISSVRYFIYEILGKMFFQICNALYGNAMKHLKHLSLSFLQKREFIASGVYKDQSNIHSEASNL